MMKQWVISLLVLSSGPLVFGVKPQKVNFLSSLIEENKQQDKVAVEHEAEQKEVGQLFWVREASSA